MPGENPAIDQHPGTEDPRVHILVEVPGSAILRSAGVEYDITREGAIRIPSESIAQLAGSMAAGETVLVVPTKGHRGSEGSPEPPFCFFDGGLIVDVARRTIHLKGTTPHLTAREYEVLEYLVRNNNRVVTKLDCYRAVWGDDVNREGDSSLAVYIKRLRAKLDQFSSAIVTRRGIGYMFCTGQEKDDAQLSVAVPPVSPERVMPCLSLAGGDVVIDGDRRELTVDGVQIFPTRREFDLLQYLVDNTGVVVSFEQIGAAVWDDPFAVRINIRTIICRVRRLLGKNGDLIRSVQGVGYMLNIE